MDIYHSFIEQASIHVYYFTRLFLHFIDINYMNPIKKQTNQIIKTGEIHVKEFMKELDTALKNVTQETKKLKEIEQYD